MATDTEFYDELETRSADARAASLAECLPAAVAHARDNAPGYAGALDDIDPSLITTVRLWQPCRYCANPI